MLEINGVDSYYEEVQALRGFSLSVKKGEVLCLLGRNGAGKTTLLKSIMGLVDVRAGSITLDTAAGKTVLTDLPAHKVPATGIGYVPQGRRLFADLTVNENLAIGLGVRNDTGHQRDKVFELFPILADRLRQRAGTLSGGEQQMLATARALCLDPSVLLMDEPTEGLQPSMIEIIRSVIKQLKSSGVTTILVEQRVDAVLPIADRVAFVENGQQRDTVEVEVLRQDPTLINRYVGVGH